MNRVDINHAVRKLATAMGTDFLALSTREQDEDVVRLHIFNTFHLRAASIEEQRVAASTIHEIYHTTGDLTWYEPNGSAIPHGYITDAKVFDLHNSFHYYYGSIPTAHGAQLIQTMFKYRPQPIEVVELATMVPSSIRLGEFFDIVDVNRFGKSQTVNNVQAIEILHACDRLAMSQAVVTPAMHRRRMEF